MQYFHLYKGLKKPLVFFGLKGKYLLYALGVILVGAFFLLIGNVIFGFFGAILCIIFIGIALWGIFLIQDKKGLYNKTKNNDELHIISMRMSQNLKR